jgi:hypothetical protein
LSVTVFVVFLLRFTPEPMFLHKVQDQFYVTDADLRKPIKSPRKRGIVLIVKGLLGACLVLSGFVYLADYPSQGAFQPLVQFFGLGLVLLAFYPPFLIAVGCLELMTGVPYDTIARGFDRLRPWQKALWAVGLSLAFVGAFVLFLYVGGAFNQRSLK